MKRIAGLLLSVAIATPVAAQEAPLRVPQRDVVVTYAQNPGGPPERRRNQEIRYSATAQRFRMTSPMNAEIFILMDPRSGAVTLVRQARNASAPMPRSDGIWWNAALRAQRLGTDTMASVACTNWRLTHPTRGQPPRGGGEFVEPSDYCFGADGVMLRQQETSGEVRMIATSVRYVAQDAREFAIPAGVRQLTFQQFIQLD